MEAGFQERTQYSSINVGQRACLGGMNFSVLFQGGWREGASQLQLQPAFLLVYGRFYWSLSYGFLQIRQNVLPLLQNKGMHHCVCLCSVIMLLLIYFYYYLGLFSSCCCGKLTQVTVQRGPGGERTRYYKLDRLWVCVTLFFSFIPLSLLGFYCWLSFFDACVTFCL